MNLPLFNEPIRTMKISPPESLKIFVDMHVRQNGSGTRSECVRELILRDQDRLQLLEKLLIGAGSAPMAPVSAKYFDGWRDRICQATANSTPR
jgi:hypothetical protein